jgi:hypothetical protein
LNFSPAPESLLRAERGLRQVETAGRSKLLVTAGSK